ncbi:MAG: alpha/beta hydrolase [Alphaproteobacteria bacterium]|jgi:pimeloyl-ACP methyl ester carboxylesterase|nr:alpha/beta hydrolase [Alphaproteobacteria bacterium]
MPHLDIAPGESLFYEYDAPGAAGATFVFVNALTGNTGMWQGAIAPALRQAGHGTLCYNFRGQIETSFADDTALTPSLIVDDLRALLDHLRPPKPILVGLSIGGLFAARALLAGAEAAALVLINTLRKPGPRIDWLGRAMVELARLGGGRLVMAANLPMIVNPEQLSAMWDDAFEAGPFESMDPNDGLFRLMAESTATDWDFPYEKLSVPVLLMTGRHDRVFYVAEDVAELAGRIADVREVVFEDAGHLIPVERPERFTKELLAFADHLKTAR